ncbi:MAG: methylmalonyl-CoA mutase family protein [Bacteroidota bacterium]
MQEIPVYQPSNPVRLVTAASLFDGHDAAINIMRRILQKSGAEVIHLGHNRSAAEIVDCAVQEDAQAIAITSYQGGHLEFFKYLYDLLRERGRPEIRLFGGGGGTILPTEIEELHRYGINRIYSPDDGRAMGLQGMINDLLQQSDFAIVQEKEEDLPRLAERIRLGADPALARGISMAENEPALFESLTRLLGSDGPKSDGPKAPVLGITGTGGAGKSSLVDEVIRRFITQTGDPSDPSLGPRVAVVSVDPSKRKSGGALLGDRIRMNAIHHPRVYMRSLATRQSNLALSRHVRDTLTLLQASRFDLILLETSGIGQSDTEIIDHSDVSLYVMTPEYGAATQLEKIDMLDFADLIAVNKFDKRGGQDALRDVKKQVQRNHNLWDTPASEMPVEGTIASQFNDPGMNRLFGRLMELLETRCGFKVDRRPLVQDNELSEKIYIIPPSRTRYLSEITEHIRRYNRDTEEQAERAEHWFALEQSLQILQEQGGGTSQSPALEALQAALHQAKSSLHGQSIRALEAWPALREAYTGEVFSYQVRGKEIKVNTRTTTLSGLPLPKISLPRYANYGDLLRWFRQENLPGSFPFTAGVFPFKREQEDPTRMFAGEGGPERTNKRFHYVSLGMPAKRLSTAFDSVTLYGNDPDRRPDIYGKIGNAGVSICCLDDAKKLYSGFDLCDPATSVSMTINGPAPVLLAFFLNAAIDQQCEKFIAQSKRTVEVNTRLNKIRGGRQDWPVYQAFGGENEPGNSSLPEGNNGLGLMLLGVSGDALLPEEDYQRIKKATLTQVRGTVQADILKEDQAQNTCIFSTEFSLRLMGDVQEYFIDHAVRNFYSVSISGYHIAEAGANPITQLAFTLANGFTYVEYYLSRGMDINRFAPNLSFFFSNGIDAEYAVIGRVARRIWAKALREKYGADERSQMLKYHIQTSGRSLHAQEIDFNDIRTTLQALYALYDNCNSLHTNAFDEAITTPTEASVRRAMAIQLIINRELGLAFNQNPLQGSFVIEELTDLVEEAVMLEFDRITERGGVLGAMESMYQRNQIQEESLHYETLKHNGDLPIIGVNTFLSKEGSPTLIPGEVIRATEAEKEAQISTLKSLNQRYPQEAAQWLRKLSEAALRQENLFDVLMEAVKYCSLGQITEALYQVGGRYRRNM